MPFYPKVRRTKEGAPIPCPFTIFTFGLTIESIQEFGGASPKIGHMASKHMLPKHKVKLNHVAHRLRLKINYLIYVM
jgi:hypothetical protein